MTLLIKSATRLLRFQIAAIRERDRGESEKQRQRESLLCIAAYLKNEHARFFNTGLYDLFET